MVVLHSLFPRIPSSLQLKKLFNPTSPPPFLQTNTAFVHNNTPRLPIVTPISSNVLYIPPSAVRGLNFGMSFPYSSISCKMVIVIAVPKVFFTSTSNSIHEEPFSTLLRNFLKDVKKIFDSGFQVVLVYGGREFIDHMLYNPPSDHVNLDIIHLNLDIIRKELKYSGGCMSYDARLHCKDVKEGDTVDVNIVASILAVKLGAARLCLFSKTPGVLVDKNNPSTTIKQATVSQMKEMCESGKIDGSMLLKVEACISALEGGVAFASVIPWGIHNSLSCLKMLVMELKSVLLSHLL